MINLVFDSPNYRDTPGLVDIRVRAKSRSLDDADTFLFTGANHIMPCDYFNGRGEVCGIFIMHHWYTFGTGFDHTSIAQLRWLGVRSIE